MQKMPSVPRAKDVMSHPPLVFGSKTSVREAADSLESRRMQSAPVVDEEGKVIGLFTQHGCVKALVESIYENMPAGLVGDHVEPVTFIEESTPLLAIADVFAKRGNANGCVPVLSSEGVMVGVVSRLDVIRAIREFVRSQGVEQHHALYLSALRGQDEIPKL